MIISRIKLNNWKNFGAVDVSCGSRVFLIGPNASGKSNFLDALRFLRDVAEDGLEKAVECRGGMKALCYLEARKNPDVTISVTLNHSWEYTLSIGSDRDGPVVRKEEVRELDVDTPKGKRIINRPDASDNEDPLRLTQTALQQVNANKKFREIPDFFSSFRYSHILPQLVRDPKAFSPNPINNDPFGRDLIFQIWKTPKKTRESRLEKINEALRLAVPNLQELSVAQDENGLPHLRVKYSHWRQHGAYQNESAFSDGTLRLLTLLWTLLNTGGPLLLEEPELSLHEDIVSQLPSMFARLDKGKKKTVRQVFITTHSQALLYDSGIGANEVLVLEPNAQGTSVSKPTEQEEQLMAAGLSAAEVLLPKTRPANVQQLMSLFEL